MDGEYTKLAIAGAGMVVLGTPALIYFSTPLLAVIAYVFCHPPQLFLGRMRNGYNQHTIRLYTSCAIMYVALAAAYGLHYLETDGFLGDSFTTWLEVVTSAGIFCFPPIYFNLIFPPVEEEENGERGEEEGEERDLTDLAGLMQLPGPLYIMTLPGTLLHTALTTKECRTAAVAYCCYASFIGCTVAAAAAADSLGLVAVESLLPYLLVASLFSLIYGLVLFNHPVLHTRSFSLLCYFLVLPAALAAVGGLHALGSTRLTTLTAVLTNVRILVWLLLLPPAMKKTFERE